MVMVIPLFNWKHPRKEIGMKTPKIKRLKMNDAVSYKKFDYEVARMATKFKGDDEQKLENLTNIIYPKGGKRCELKTTGNRESLANG